MVLCQSQLPRAAFMQTANCFKCTRQFEWNKGSAGGKEERRCRGGRGKGVTQLCLLAAGKQCKCSTNCRQHSIAVPRMIATPPPHHSLLPFLPHLAKWFVRVCVAPIDTLCFELFLLLWGCLPADCIRHPYRPLDSRLCACPPLSLSLYVQCECLPSTSTHSLTHSPPLPPHSTSLSAPSC